MKLMIPISFDRCQPQLPNIFIWTIYFIFLVIWYKKQRTKVKNTNIFNLYQKRLFTEYSQIRSFIIDYMQTHETAMID